MAAFAAELEACLAEPDWPGGSETVVLAPPRRRVQRQRPPHRGSRAAALLIALGLAIAVAVLAVVLIRNHGSPSPSSGGGGGTPVALSAVSSFSATGPEHPEDVAKATDGNTATFWETHDYRYPDGGLGKPGVGLVLDAGSSRTLHHLTITSDTPGFTADVEAGDASSGPFHAVSSPETVGAQTTFDLTNATGRYFVIWITRVPASGRAHVNEVSAS